MKRDRTGKFVQTWDGERKRAVKLSLTTTAWQILEQQSQVQGVSRSELVETYARQLQIHSPSSETESSHLHELQQTNQQLQTRIAELEHQFESVQQTLQQTEERLQVALDSANATLWDVNLQTNRVIYSGNAINIWGTQEGTAETFFTVIHPEDQPKAMQALNWAIATNQHYAQEYRVICSDGTTRWLNSRGQIDLDAMQKKPVRMVGISIDITERKFTEEALRQSKDRLRSANERFRLAAMAVNCLIYDWDLEQDYVERTEGLTQVLGYSLEEAEPTGNWWRKLIHPDDLKEVLEKSQIALVSGDQCKVEYRVLNKKNEYVYMLDQCLVVTRDATGMPTRIVGSTTDITDRKRTEAALRESEERLRMALDAGKAGVWDWDILKNRITWSEQIYEFHGLTPETFGGTLEEFSALIHPDDRDRVFTKVREALQDREPYQIELRALHPDGTVRWLSTSGQVFYHDEQPIRMLGATLDITERKQAEAEREDLLQRERESREAAEAANRIKDEFLAVLSHELRSPLNPILGWTRLLRTRSFDPQASDRALETIERNAKLQAQLIEDLLDVSRILQGKLRLNIKPVNLITTIEAALETVQLSAEAKAINLRYEVCGSVRAWMDRSVNEWTNANQREHPNLDNKPSASHLIEVMGDPARLQQIIWNLLSNAIKFTPNGGQVEVKLATHEVTDEATDEKDNTGVLSASSAAKSVAQITVVDTGQGISPEFLPHVFEYFRQADSSTTRQFGGLGLGLAIVRHLVELHGGVVAVESPGKGLGATFVVRLPLREYETARKKKPEKSDSLIPPLPDFSLQGVEILVVDDEADMRDLIDFILSEQGAIVKVAASATEALELLSRSVPDILISDIGMPKIDGYLLMQQVRQRPPEKGGKVPALALTAYAGELNQKRALAAGFQLHVTKPIEPAELIKTIVSLLDKA